jgi:hypothetical protein
MATRAVQTVITYRAWDTSANAPKTGDSANHTLKWIKDGTSASTTNSPSEVDSTNAKGLYKITMTSTECDCLMGSLAGVSSTSNVALFGPQIGFEYIPNTASGTTGGLPLAVDSSGRVDVLKINGTSQTARDLGASVLISAGTGTGQLDVTSGVISADAKKINAVSTSSVTAVNANIGTTQPMNFTGTAGSALVKTDVTDIATVAVSTSTAQIGVNVVNFGGSAGTFASGRAEVDLNSSATTELAAVPSSTAKLKDMIQWLYLLGRNKITQTSTTTLVKANDGSTTVGTSTVSDDGTTFTRGAMS